MSRTTWVVVIGSAALIALLVGGGIGYAIGLADHEEPLERPYCEPERVRYDIFVVAFEKSDNPSEEFIEELTDKGSILLECLQGEDSEVSE
ncbi:MAG: hypothetical protein GY701_22195 [Sulfitobacter sp.]|nr:hypothetical protein [Sulfitobacter sp.]